MVRSVNMPVQAAEPCSVRGFDFDLVIRFSQGNAVRQSDGAAGVRHRLHCSAALHTAGGDARPGKLGRQEVSVPPITDHSVQPYRI